MLIELEIHIFFYHFDLRLIAYLLNNLLFTSVQAAMDVTQISRSVEQLFCHTEQVKKFVYLYLLKMLRQKRQRQQEQTS